MVNESTTDLLVPENALAGLIPTQIGQLGHLTHLFLGSNQLTGACGETSLIAIGKRVYHSPNVLCRQHSDGAWTFDGYGVAGSEKQPVNRYGTLVTMLHALVNESTSDSFVTEMRWQVPFPPKLGSWGS